MEVVSPAKGKFYAQICFSVRFLFWHIRRIQSSFWKMKGYGQTCQIWHKDQNPNKMAWPVQWESDEQIALPSQFSFMPYVPGNWCGEVFEGVGRQGTVRVRIPTVSMHLKLQCVESYPARLTQTSQNKTNDTKQAVLKRTQQNQTKQTKQRTQNKQTKQN